MNCGKEDKDSPNEECETPHDKKDKDSPKMPDEECLFLLLPIKGEHGGICASMEECFELFLQKDKLPLKCQK